jgi:voltage-gated potassium channel
VALPISTETLREYWFHILHKPTPENLAARYINYFLAIMIITNALFVSLETVPYLKTHYGQYFAVFEMISTGIFIVEYLLRIWVCVEQQRYANAFSGRLKYAVHPLPLLDLVVILTYWAPIDVRFLRVARMVRLLKVLRLQEFEKSLVDIGLGLRKRRELMLVAVTLMVLSVYASSAILYQLEHDAQPQVFTSIPATFWWSIETLTTIGYGDMVPITALGKIFTGLIAVFGIGVFALPMAIVTAVIIESGIDKPSQEQRQKEMADHKNKN